MAGNPNWWSFVPPSQQPLSASSSTYPVALLPENHELSQSWSQLLFGDVADDDDGFNSISVSKPWVDDQIYDPSFVVSVAPDVKKEPPHFAALQGCCPWAPLPPSSGPTSSSKSVLDFANSSKTERKSRHSNQTSECNDTASGAVCKKIKVQPHMKVRKEKLGDRITTLHQLVSPFGKTDTASVLLEAIGYIRFLQGQIQALSTSYVSSRINQQPVQREMHTAYLEESGQLLNDICGNKKRAQSQENQDTPRDLNSRGLCLVPLSCTQHVGEDYWSSSISRGL